MNPYLDFTQTLGRLRESSRHAIIDGETSILDNFKRNLHVEREVERQLKSLIINASQSNDAQLILICGNVGDGKSHMLSHLRGEMADSFSRFSVHNDATEAFNPNESFEDTLVKVLENFKDSKINDNQQKQLLAINLGTLNNFLLEKGEEFQQLKQYVNSKGILDTEAIEDDGYNENVNFQYVNFTDYQLYELTPTGAQSEVITKLFDNIFNKKTKNPIYQAYKGFKKKYQNSYCPIIYNYEFLLLKENRDFIIKLMIKAIVKSKGIVSFRAILNFIYDIVIPVGYRVDKEESFEKLLKKSTHSKYITNILPNYIFTKSDLSNLFSIISEEDPCNKRSETIDDSIIQVINTEELGQLAYEFYSNKLLQGNLLNSLPKIQSNKHLLSQTHIRLVYFNNCGEFGLEDKDYNDFIQYLYATNKGDKKGIKKLYQTVINACQRWNGNPNEKKSIIIELGARQKNYRILKNFNPIPEIRYKYMEEDILKRFSPQLSVNLKSHKKALVQTLFIDSGLLKLLNKVNKGYRPNKLDKNSYVNFINFLSTLIESDIESEQIKIDEVNIGKSIDYLFHMDSFGEYKFEKYQ